MRHKVAFLSLLTAALLAAAPCDAQAQTQPVHFSFGGGLTVPNSEVADRLGNGYNFNLGVDFAVKPAIYIEGLYSFNGLGDKRISIPLSPTPFATTTPTDFFSDMNMQDGTGNVIFQRPEGGSVPTDWWAWACTIARSRSRRPESGTRRGTAIPGGTIASPAAGCRSRTSSANAAPLTSVWISAVA